MFSGRFRFCAMTEIVRFRGLPILRFSMFHGSRDSEIHGFPDFVIFRFYDFREFDISWMSFSVVTVVCDFLYFADFRSL